MYTIIVRKTELKLFERFCEYIKYVFIFVSVIVKLTFYYCQIRYKSGYVDMVIAVWIDVLSFHRI